MNYDNVAAPTGTAASVKIGDKVIARSTSAAGADGAAKAAFTKAATEAIRARLSGRADPAEINYVMTVILLTILVVYVTMVYGPIAAWLVELFPTRIRYTGMSLPYHIGNGWFGGFLPATAFAIVAATGNIYSGLWYPIVVAAHELRRRAVLPAGDEGPRHLQERLTAASCGRQERRLRNGPPFPFHVFRTASVPLAHEHERAGRSRSGKHETLDRGDRAVLRRMVMRPARQGAGRRSRSAGGGCRAGR